MAKIYITRNIPEVGPASLRDAGHEVVVSEKDGVLTKDELIAELEKHNPDAVLCLLTDTIDAEVFDAAPNVKIFANYAVGYNNIDTEEAKKRGIIVTNTPGVLTDTVAEHTVALILSAVCRIPEADRFTRAGKYDGWAPELLLGMDLKGKTLGILGAGRIGSRVSEILHNGFGMQIAYYDIKQNEILENSVQATYRHTPEDLLRDADVVSVHVPLLESTKHLLNETTLSVMKPTAYLVNSSRGPVIDENALVKILQENKIKGAALDVFEEEPVLADGLADLENVILTPHIASASEETRGKMSEMAAENILAVLSGSEPLNKVV